MPSVHVYIPPSTDDPTAPNWRYCHLACVPDDVDGWTRETHAGYTVPFCERCYVCGQFLAGFYLNVYAVGRAYGGPEEGGWWYDYGKPLASVPVVNESHAMKVAADLKEHFSYMASRSRFSALGGTDVECYNEDHVAVVFPSEVPRYE